MKSINFTFSKSKSRQHNIKHFLDVKLILWLIYITFQHTISKWYVHHHVYQISQSLSILNFFILVSDFYSQFLMINIIIPWNVKLNSDSKSIQHSGCLRYEILLRIFFSLAHLLPLAFIIHAFFCVYVHILISFINNMFYALLSLAFFPVCRSSFNLKWWNEITSQMCAIRRLSLYYSTFIIG